MTTACSPRPPAATDYESFLATKLASSPPTGIDAPRGISRRLFPFQRDIVKWAMRRGRAAIFADTGLGKGWMALEWLRHVEKHTGKPALLLAPLAVSHQFVREAEKFGVDVRSAASDADVAARGIYVTNYHKLHKFDASRFGAVAIDESSILKSFTSTTRDLLIETFRATPFRLALTATPAPNDFMELGNHAEFLGVMSRVEMLSMFFVHDMDTTQEWRLKGHAEAAFWKWCASWAVTLRRPSDLGYDDDAYALPPLRYHHHVIPASQAETFAAGVLFAEDAVSLADQRGVRKATIESRVKVAADIANTSIGPVVVWCDLNDEGKALAKSIPDAVEVAGADTDEHKESALENFADGRTRVMVSKSSICGFGLNWQHCRTVVFCGVTHSFESYYQAIRRCWRFGQTHPVDVHVITSENEGRVIDSLQRKQADAARMGDAMVKAMAETTIATLGSAARTFDAYTARTPMCVPAWLTSDFNEAES